VRNSSLVESLCAYNTTGLSVVPKLRTRHLRVVVVEEHSVGRRRCVARHAGGIGRENAGMSNEKTGEIPVRRKPKVSRVKVICPRVSRLLRRGGNA
jgi:hypothetical protein